MTLSALRLRSNLRCLMAREQYFVLFHDNQCGSNTTTAT